MTEGVLIVLPLFIFYPIFAISSLKIISNESQLHQQKDY